MKIHVLGAGAAKGLVSALEPQFTAETGAQVQAAFSAVGAIREKFLAGELCDVLILTATLLDQLQQDGQIAPGTSRPLGRVQTGVAARSGEPLPGIATGAALRSALTRAAAIYLPDPQRATAGIHFVRVLHELGIHSEVASRLRAFSNGATAMAGLARAQEEGCLGCTQISEIRYTQGVTLVGPLPGEFALATVYSVGVSARAAAPDLAWRFAALLTAPEHAGLRLSGGFEPTEPA